MQNKICVYAICKNESQFVEKWCNSMKEADCVVALDTGSTDDTVERLKAQGVNVVSKEINPWRFDVARNEAIKLVPDDCNILVSTDLDEYFDEGWADKLRSQWIDGQHKRCIYTYYNHLVEPCKKMLYNKIHSRGWYWKYPVHELLLKESDNTEDLSPEEELSLADSVVLYHYPDLSKVRGDYIDLLKIRSEENPKDYFGLYYLVIEYEKIDLDKAFETAMRGVDNSDNDFYKFVFTVKLAFISENKYNFGQALKFFMNAIQLNTEYRFVFFHAARLLFDVFHDYEMAYQVLYDGLKYSYWHESWFEESYGWGSEYYDLMSLAAYYSGKKVESLILALVANNRNDTEDENERLKRNINSIFNAITEKEITDYEE